MSSDGMELIPLEDFFRKPDKARVRLSPGGEYLSFMQPFERRLNLFVKDLRTGAQKRLTSSTRRDIGAYAWVNNDRLVYLQDSDGDENHHLFAVGRDGSNPLDLTPFDGVKCSLVDDLEEIDEEVLFQMNRRDRRVFDVYRLNVDTGEMTVIAENPGNVQRWITDHEGKLRMAVTTDGVDSSILYRETEQDDWRVVATYNFKEAATPLAFTFDNKVAFVLSNLGRDKAAVCEFDLGAGREGRLLFEHPQVDVAGLLYSKRRKVLTAAIFVTDKPGYEFFDSERERIQAFLDERLPGYEKQLISHSRAEDRFVVHWGNDRTRGGYHLLDARRMELTPLFELTPWLEEDRMAPMRSIRYRADDGLTIHGYLTLPSRGERRDLPLVVNPHGGPWVRDTWGFNPEVQFLASRGFAVLQMNYRGSSGYGRRFLEAGFGQWGLAMQDDISAGVRWAIGEGFADPKRVAIYGGSYGGYAALSGLTRTPELYACGISYVGVSNLFTWMAAIPPYWKPYLEMMHEMVGDPDKDEIRFRETSPFFHSDRIGVPLLVAQGANDPRVPKAESDQIVEALRRRNVEVEYLVRDNEGHGFSNEENQFAFYGAMEAFLLRHIGERRSEQGPRVKDR